MRYDGKAMRYASRHFLAEMSAATHVLPDGKAMRYGIITCAVHSSPSRVNNCRS